ncbi:MAG: DUF6443 domain-containing protein, partial [Bacteroidota bacterium]
MKTSRIKSISYLLLHFLLILGMQHPLWAGEEIFFKQITGAPIAANASETVVDNLFGTGAWSTIEENISVANLLLFEIDETSAKMKPSQTCTYEASIQVELWRAGDDPTGAPSETIYETLQITFDAVFSNVSQHQAFKMYEGAHQMKITVTSILPVSGNFNNEWPAFRVYGEIVVNRKYLFNSTLFPNINNTPSFPQSTFYDVGWTGMAGAEEYDLEWTFYDYESEVGAKILNNDFTNYNDFDWLFQNNATRVSLPESSYKVQLLYPGGYVFFRVRGVRYTADGVREFGVWSSSIGGSLPGFGDKIRVFWHENNYLNWQASTVFAEKGKHVPTVQYFDGSLRQRQSVTLSNAIDQTIVSQTIYDHHGRPAVNVLPTPSGNSQIGFDPLFATHTTGTPYSKNNFDLGDCDQAAVPMSTNTGAAKYFSPNHSTMIEGQDQYIPDAQGFPFTQTEFTPDQTGRVKRQSGVGSTYQMNGGKETKYYYAKPAQVELDRLFGNDVGVATHYQKNLVVDANGQISVSYIDAHGRTVATAMAGSKPDNVEQIDEGYAADVPLDINLLDNQSEGNALVSREVVAVVTPGDHSFSYSLDPKTYNNANQSCIETDICLDCLYELTITITDDDCNAFNSNQPYTYSLSNFSLG